VSVPKDVAGGPDSSDETAVRPSDPPRGPTETTRFTPGTLLAGRYRIVAPLGKGGMGEVYRADDLKLRQAVALKFLPASVASDPSRLARFYDEVRTAREVSHPNVCRVHDLGEAEGQHFLSMEYVDGEDLASLLRRIGRLPRDKGLEVARQLCAGLAAAHEKGVLHRDLKPANVMIDGRGRVRLADFGLAGLAEEIQGQPGAGTPAYMSPEQFAGRDVSVRSDIYALGLVLYEVFTGKPVFQGASRTELARMHESGVPSRPSSLVPDVEPAIERAILRCLEKDPSERPASALAVSAALPGGDPLAAALAAGITPSPDMVAAAGEVGVLGLPVAWACFGSIAVGIVVAGLLARGSALYRHVPLEKPPDVLTDRARQIVKQAGIVDTPADDAGWFESSWQDNLYCGLAPVCFVYRQSPTFLEPRSETVRRRDPPLQVPGMVSVVLTTEGRLTRFSLVPPSFDDTKDPPPADWSPFLSEAGFELSDMESADAVWTPPVASDGRAAWLVKDPSRKNRAVRVEAASFHGRPVDFRVVWAWDQPPEKIAWAEYPLFHRLFGWWGLIPLGTLVTVLAAAILARRNLRLGRSDRTGAYRLAAVFLAARALGDLLVGHHVPSVLAESRIVKGPLMDAFWNAASMWLFYVALEPYARRRWPQVLISWSRLLAGRVRDPLVGRDVLIGALCGTVVALVWHVSHFAPSWIGSWQAPFSGGVEALSSARRIPGELLMGVGEAIRWALVSLFVLTLYRIVARIDVLAVLLLIVTNVVFNLWWFPTGSDVRLEVMFLALIMSISAVVLVRFGLLALVAEAFFLFALQSLPIALDLGAWYAGHALLALGLLAAVAAVAFHVSLAGRTAFGGRLLEE
jgi:hypothetical protein